MWDLPAVPARRLQRQVHCQNPTFTEQSDLGRLHTGRVFSQKFRC
jgi:hypothetical protein